MATEETTGSDFIPDTLFHTCLTVNEHSGETSEAVPRVYILGTHATVEAAKRFASGVIPTLGYDREDFDVYEERSRDTEEWEHGDGVVVYAKAPAGQEFLVGIDTKLNTEDLRASNDGSIVLPHGIDHLHYLLQTTIEYRADRAASTEIQGAYTKRNDALEAAKWCLLIDGGTEADFAQFDSRGDLDQPEDWPYGEDVLIHAVAQTGENYLITLRTPPAAYLRHSKDGPKHHKAQAPRLSVRKTKTA